MKNDYPFLFIATIVTSFIVALFLPFFGHVVLGMALGCWACNKASIPVIWTVFLGSTMGATLGGWVIFDHTLSAILFVIAVTVGFWGMYFYTPKQPFIR